MSTDDRSPPQAGDPETVSELDLQRYLSGRTTVSRAYREASAETVPPDLDAQVLEHAREAVAQADAETAGSRRWQLPLALAATLLIGVPLAFKTLQQLGSAPRMPAEAMVAMESSAPAAELIEPSADEARLPVPPAPVAKPARPRPAAVASAPAAEPDAAGEAPAQDQPPQLQRQQEERERTDDASTSARFAQTLQASPPAKAQMAFVAAPLAPMPTSWRLEQPVGGRYVAQQDQAYAFEGEASLAMTGDASGSFYADAVQELDAAPYRGKRLLVEARLSHALERGGATLLLQVLDAGGTVTAEVLGTQLWAPRKFGMKPDWILGHVDALIPEPAARLRIGIRMQGGTGTVWMDAVSLAEVPPGLAVEDADRSGLPLPPQPMNPGFEQVGEP